MSRPAKRPPLTALLRESSPASLTPEEQQRIQAENDQKLYGTRMSVELPAAAPIVAPEPADAPIIVGDRWIPFGTYLHDQVYLQLKQAEFWEPGFEIRRFVNQALQHALTDLSGAQRDLPVEQLATVLKKINRTKS